MKISLLFTTLAATAATALPGNFLLPSMSSKESSPATARLLLSHTGNIYVADRNGSDFNFTFNQTVTGDPSWVRMDGKDRLYAVDELSTTLRAFDINLDNNTMDLKSEVNGSLGVVHLEFNRNRTRMVGAAYGNGTIDIWNTANKGLQLMKTIPSVGKLGPNQTMRHPHQALLDPTGRFFAVNDLGSDTIVIIDSQDDRFEISSYYTLPASERGCGPRHGAFYPYVRHDADPFKATHYMVVCELSNEVHIFALEYTPKTILFRPRQCISTFGPGYGPANATSAAAGELLLSPDSEHVYISNRVTGNATGDSIAHFKVHKTGSKCGTEREEIELAFAGSAPSRGINPRMMSFGANASVIYVGNQDGEKGLIALERGKDGMLGQEPVASIDLDVFGAPGFGPQFVQQID